MIRYPITEAELRQRIAAAVPTWFARAQVRTDAYAAAGDYLTSPSSIWSEIKRVYMELQGFKCGFCERRLERSAFGNVEHDVEHFRPKAMVEAWPPASAPERAAGLGFPLGAGSPKLGYFLLPHHHENYLISCKTCNSAFKSNGFPVEGPRDLNMPSPRQTPERPFLVNPLSLFDDDPQKLIRFNGIVPVAAAAGGRRRRRGEVIIRFFGLAERDGLLLERSITLAALHLALVNVPGADLTSRLARHLVATLTADQAAHANCARCFVALWADDRPAALQFSQEALKHLASVP